MVKMNNKLKTFIAAQPSKNVKDVPIKLNDDNAPGGFPSLDCNDTDIGAFESTNSTLTTPTVEGVLTMTGNQIKGGAEGSDPTDFATVSQIGGGGITTYYGQGNDVGTTNYTPLIVGTVGNKYPFDSSQATSGTSYNFTGISFFSATESLIEIANVSPFNIGQIIDLTSTFSYASQMYVVKSIEISGTTGLVVELVFVSDPGAGTLTVLDTFSSFQTNNGTLENTFVGGSEWKLGTGLLGALNDFGSITNLITDAIMHNITVPDPTISAFFIRITQSTSTNGIFRALKTAANTYALGIPFAGTDSGKWEFVVPTPTYTSSAANLIVTFNYCYTVVAPVTKLTSAIELYKSSSSSGTEHYQVVQGSRRTDVSPIGNNWQHSGSILDDVTSDPVRYVAGIGNDAPDPAQSQIKFPRFAFYGVT